MEKIEVILVKAKETKGTWVYEEELGEVGKPPVLKASVYPALNINAYPAVEKLVLR